MNLLLDSVSDLIIYNPVNYTGGWMWLVTAIRAIVTLVSSVGVGIMLFTLVLKLITLPLDIFSRVSMRKNSLKMEEMRPQLEKLQKQYANDKALYNQKMMALYKKNGYSMMGGCLPTIVTLVIFMIALTGFQKYSVYENTKYYSDMCLSYNQAAYDNFATENIFGKENVILLNADSKNHELFINRTEINKVITGTEGAIPTDGVYFINNGELTSGTDWQIKVTISSTNEGDGKSKEHYAYEINKPESYLKALIEVDGSNENVKFQAIEEKFDSYTNYQEWLKSVENVADTTIEKTPEFYIKTLQRKYAADSFRKSNQSFLWINNIWVADSPLEKVAFASSKTFKSKTGIKDASITDETYNELTHDLSKEKKQVNGYFIMVILTIGSSLLTQWITTRGQKAQLELQSVDGSGAKQQKMMMIIMPVIMAIFAFMYTAAFSIYIILSSLLSTVFTLIINKSVEVSFKNKKLKMENAGDKRIRGTSVEEVTVVENTAENDGAKKNKKKKNKKDESEE